MSTNTDSMESIGFINDRGQWFYRINGGQTLGPFYSMCITQLDERKHYECEIVEPELSALLRQLV